MALLLFTGFDYYNTAQTNRLWRYVVGNGAIVSPGRLAGQCYSFSNVGVASYINQSIPNATTVIVGVAFNFSTGDATNPFLLLQDASINPTSPITQIDVRVTTDQAFQITRDGAVLGTTSNGLFAWNYWNYLELRTTINTTGGTIQFKLNGSTLLNLSSLNTQETGNNFVNMIQLQAFTTGTATASFDDIYVCDNTGSHANNFLGEVRVQTQYPSANGTENDFTAFGAISNWQCVDSTISTDGTTYVRSDVVGNIDDYVMGTVSLSGTIYGVQVNVTMRKDDVGDRTVSSFIHSGGSNFTGSLVNCQTDYTVAQAIFPLEPSANVAWTNSSINAMNAGLKIEA